jgi:hypothetical protein
VAKVAATKDVRVSRFCRDGSQTATIWGLGHAEQGLGKLTGPLARPDYPQGNAFARCRAAVFAERRGWHNDRRRHGCQGGGLQKTPPRKLRSHGILLWKVVK